MRRSITSILLVVLVGSLLAVTTTPVAAGSQDTVKKRRTITITHHGNDYQVELLIWDSAYLTTNFRYGQFRFDDDGGGTALKNQWHDGVQEADRIRVDWLNLERNNSVVEICDQTSSSENNDGAGCNEGEEGVNGPIKGFHDIENSPWASPCECAGHVNYSQTGKSTDPPGSQTYKVVVKFQIEWHTGAVSPWFTEQLQWTE